MKTYRIQKSQKREIVTRMTNVKTFLHLWSSSSRRISAITPAAAAAAAAGPADARSPSCQAADDQRLSRKEIQTAAGLSPTTDRPTRPALQSADLCHAGAQATNPLYHGPSSAMDSQTSLIYAYTACLRWSQSQRVDYSAFVTAK